MRKSVVLTLLLAAALSACAQQQTIVLGHSAVPLTGPWKFSPGDSPWVGTAANGHFLWAEPGFDDSGWALMDMTPAAGSLDVQFHSQGYVPGWTKRGYPRVVRFAWYRLRIHVDSQNQPLWLAMPSDVDDGYQVFVNGRFVGQMGWFEHDRVNVRYAEATELQLPHPAPDGDLVLAIRFYMSPTSPWRWPEAGGLHNPPVIGLRSVVELLYEKSMREAVGFVFGNFLSGLVFLLAIPLCLWAWKNNRSDPAWLWLLLAVTAQCCASTAQVVALLDLHASMAFGEFWQYVAFAPLLQLFWVLFWWHWFGLQDRRWIRTAAWLLAAGEAVAAVGLRLPVFGFPYTPAKFLHVCSTAGVWLSAAEALLLFALLVEGFRRDRTAALAAGLPILLLAFNNFYVPLLAFFGLPLVFWFGGLSVSVDDLAAIFMLLIVGWLALRRFLANRDREVIERETITRDLEQARELQQGVLVAESVRSAAWSVDVAYRPAQTVGGDFFLTVEQPDHTLLVVIGDVSGKGIGAAMLVAVLVGSARTAARQSTDPAFILSELNLQLLGRSGGHFATCLVGVLRSDGALRLANAGHLPPYRNGEELPLPPALPLGVSSDAEYAETTLQLTLGDSLTFLSDGVVEAQSPTGELFGFDRTRAISTRSAEEIARAAQAFGQQDDITVLTLIFAPAEVRHA